MTSLAYSSVLQSNKVLRNAFMLLAISMVPTVIGAFVGAAIGVPAFMASSALVSSIVFLGISFGMLYLISKNQNSSSAIPLMLGFTFLMGMWLSGILSSVLALRNGTEIVAMAGLGTLVVAATCSIYAMTTKRDFSGMGGFLFGAVIGLIVISLANIFLQMPIISIVISAVALLVFSAFMVFDVQRVVNGGETNYVMAATSIYLNIYNIFSSLLQLLGVFNGDD